jgi:hypothetical protein
LATTTKIEFSNKSRNKENQTSQFEMSQNDNSESMHVAASSSSAASAVVPLKRSASDAIAASPRQSAALRELMHKRVAATESISRKRPPANRPLRPSQKSVHIINNNNINININNINNDSIRCCCRRLQ